MEIETALNPRQCAMNRTMIISKKCARRPGLPQASPGAKNGKIKSRHENISNNTQLRLSVTDFDDLKRILRQNSVGNGIAEQILEQINLKARQWEEVIEKYEKDNAMECQLYELKMKAASKNSQKAIELFKILDENGIDIDAILINRSTDSIGQYLQNHDFPHQADDSSATDLANNHSEKEFKLMRENDALNGEINSLEENYSNLFKMYQKVRLNCVNLKEVEQSLHFKLEQLGRKYSALQKMYTELLVEAQKKLEDANEELKHCESAQEQKTLSIRLTLKRAQIRIGSLETAMELKNKENTELHAICDQLIEAREQFDQINSNSAKENI